MQENLAAQIAETGTDQPIDGDGVVLGYRDFLAHLPPMEITVIRATDAGTLGRGRIAIPLKPV